MATKPTTLPQWATTGTVTEPSAGKKALGWIAEKPPFAYLNWILNLVYQWIQYLDAPVGTGSNPGFSATGGPTNGTGLKGTGGGTTGLGVHGVAAANGAGVCGEATAGSGVTGTCTTGVGVVGVSTGSGNGVEAGSIGTGYALHVSGDMTSPVKAAIHIAAQDTQPTGPNAIGDIYMTTAGVLKVCTVAGQPGTWVSVGSQT